MTLFGIIIAFIVICQLFNWAEASDIGAFVVFSALATFAAVLCIFMGCVIIFTIFDVMGAHCGDGICWSMLAAPAIGMIYTHNMMSESDVVKPSSRNGCLAVGMVLYGLFLWGLIVANTQ